PASTGNRSAHTAALVCSKAYSSPRFASDATSVTAELHAATRHERVSPASTPISTRDVTTSTPESAQGSQPVFTRLASFISFHQSQGTHATHRTGTAHRQPHRTGATCIAGST